MAFSTSNPQRYPSFISWDTIQPSLTSSKLHPTVAIRISDLATAEETYAVEQRRCKQQAEDLKAYAHAHPHTSTTTTTTITTTTSTTATVTTTANVSSTVQKTQTSPASEHGPSCALRDFSTSLAPPSCCPEALYGRIRTKSPVLSFCSTLDLAWDGPKLVPVMVQRWDMSSREVEVERNFTRSMKRGSTRGFKNLARGLVPGR